MAKEIAIGKRLKISQAQEYMLLAVLGAAIVLGACLSIAIHLIKTISFNAEVIAAKEQAIKSYSDTIKNVGVCKKPNGDTYSNDELNKCNPNGTSISSVSGTLRANILEGLAANKNLGVVMRESGAEDCINPETQKLWTYEEMEEKYEEAEDDTAIEIASDRIKTCSALRVVPDALPAVKNESALLSSLNQLFKMSGWEPEALSPSGATIDKKIEGLNMIAVNLSVEADMETTKRVINNIEKSIREFDIQTATIEWGGSNSLNLKAQAIAYYVDESELVETTKTIKVDKEKKKK